MIIHNIQKRHPAIQFSRFAAHGGGERRRMGEESAVHEGGERRGMGEASGGGEGREASGSA